MAAGSEIVQRVEREVDDILREDPTIKHLVDTAASHVDGVTRSDASALRDAALMLAERDAMTIEAANADVHGHLLDLSDILLRFRSPHPASDG